MILTFHAFFLSLFLVFLQTLTFLKIIKTTKNLLKISPYTFFTLLKKGKKKADFLPHFLKKIV